MGDHLRHLQANHYGIKQSYPGQLSLAIPLWVGIMSNAEEEIVSSARMHINYQDYWES